MASLIAITNTRAHSGDESLGDQIIDGSNRIDDFTENQET